VRASYHRQSLEIEYDEDKVGKEEILAAVARLGYTADPD
jgi:copper chaperone CopZ